MITCATWNVTSLNKDVQKLAVLEVMESLKIDILAVQETQCLNQLKEQFIKGKSGRNFLFVHTGVQLGVGFIISPKILPLSLENFTEVSPRILQLDLSEKLAKKTILFSVYSPTDQKESSPNIKKNKAFYSLLQKTLDGLPRSAVTVLLGDFNCTLRQKHHFPPFIGPFALRDNIGDCFERTNADSLFEIVCSNKLQIVNTLTKKRMQEQSTYEPPQTTPPSEQKLHVKDLIVTNCESHQYQVHHAQAITHTNHHLVVYKMTAKKKRIANNNAKRTLCLQPLRSVKGAPFESKLRNIDPRYAAVLSNNLDLQCKQNLSQESQDVDIDNFYQSLVQTIQQTCNLFSPETHPKKNWCSTETAELCKRKNKEWKLFIQTKGSAHLSNYRTLSKKVQKSLKDDKQNFFAFQSAKLELKKTPPLHVADNVALFFPTKNSRKISKPCTALPQVMRASDSDPLQPRKTAMKTHLTKIYAEKRFSWTDSFLTVQESDEQKIQKIWDKTNKKLPRFLPPMNKKAPGKDGIFLHCLLGSDRYLEKLLDMMQSQGKVPKGFKESLVFPLFKKGNKSVFDCYRTLSLRPIIANYLFRSYLPTCREITKLTVLPFQFNRPHHNCQDNVFILGSLIDMCRVSKTPLFLFFTDLRKAFDSVARPFLFRVLEKRCPARLASILIHLHEGAVLTFEELKTLTESGVLQGDTLAAVLFVWVMDEILRCWENKKNPHWGIRIFFRKGEILQEFLPHEWEKASAVEIRELLLNWLAFADDVMFLSTDLTEIIEQFKLFVSVCAAAGLEVASSKCALMSMEWNKECNVSTPRGEKIIVDSHCIPIVNEYRYLGVLISNSGTFTNHVDDRSKKSLGTVLGRIKNVESWVGKNASLLLEQLNVCFAPCLSWGTDVVSLSKTDTEILDVSFFKYLRRVFRVKFDEETGKWEKNKKELKEISELQPPSETLPLARLKFFFHTLTEEICYPSDCFLNGKILNPDGSFSGRDKRYGTYAKEIEKDWKKFGLTQLSRAVAAQPSFQKNIFNECCLFGDSFFASVAGKSELVFQGKKIHDGGEATKKRDNPNFPNLSGNQMVLLFATDGSLSKDEDPPVGAFSIVDSFNNSFVSEVPCTKNTSSTEIELLALKKLFESLDNSQITDFIIVLLVDSLSALKLTLGIDVRNEQLETFRKIDQHRRRLQERKVLDIFIHVRSHRKISVALNCEADYQAGGVSLARCQSVPRETLSKCKPPECKADKNCDACDWNKKVNEFLCTFRPSVPPASLQFKT